MTWRKIGVVSLGVVLGACGGAASRPPVVPPAVSVPNQIIGARMDGTVKELLARGENALLAQRWQEAVDAFETAIAGDAATANDPRVIYDLAIAYEGLGEREKARARYREVVRRFPDDANARNALAREVSLDAYLEDWPALGEVGGVILARKDIDPAERMLGLGARGLSRIQAGDEAAASHDIQAGLDLVDELRYGATGQLPVAAAMLKFAHGELRRFRSEKLALDPGPEPGPEFLVRLEARCQGLLDAQSAYADAMRAADPHWAAMSGYRVGEMYRTLHHDLMLIPPPTKAKTERDRQLFFGIMHVRYRAFLDKGVEMMKRTLTIGERTGAGSAWMRRAEAAKAEMEMALEAERAQIATFPFTEAELQKALDIMIKHAQEKPAKAPTKR